MGRRIKGEGGSCKVGQQAEDACLNAVVVLMVANESQRVLRGCVHPGPHV